jgi:hypothetical protein
MATNRREACRRNWLVIVGLEAALCANGSACGPRREEAASVQATAPDILEKSEGFTDEERLLIERARVVIRERKIDVSGLEERLSRFGNVWFVGYSPPGHRGVGGGGWSVAFRYPSGEFLAVEREQ